MARQRKNKAAEQQAGYIAEVMQPPLVPMSDEELKDAAQMLALKIKTLEETKTHNDSERKQMRSKVHKLEQEIQAIASTVRNQGR